MSGTLIVEAGSALHRQALIRCAGTTQGVLVLRPNEFVCRFVDEGCEVLEAREYVGAARAALRADLEAGGAA